LATPDAGDGDRLRKDVPPDPPTNILIVPFGPKFVFMTSYSPFAALMFMNRAASLFITSAFGFNDLTDDISAACIQARAVMFK
jgi:hypothetical protein